MTVTVTVALATSPLEQRIVYVKVSTPSSELDV
jgi:hypothetical protein